MTDAKTQLVQSWLTKAQHDLASARVLSMANPPLLDTAIYHCQQAAEKTEAPSFDELPHKLRHLIPELLGRVIQ